MNFNIKAFWFGWPPAANIQAYTCTHIFVRSIMILICICFLAEL
jgi:hypothetical protein